MERALREFAARLTTTVPARLAEAMSYSLLAGGKRLRPILALASCEAAGGLAPGGLALDFAVALELVHTYSLVHDDLPAMDDDDLRRGRPTCHKVFGEATAILAGDALLTEAFGVVASGSEPARVRLTALLSRAAGASGMVGGQQLDLALDGRLDSAALPPLAEVEEVHRRKTGALLASATEGGAIAAGAGEERVVALRRYGEALGLAFQIADDLLDVEGDPAVTGKSGGGDRARGKPTYPALVGAVRARELAVEARDRSLGALELPGGFPGPVEALRALANHAIERRF